MIVKICGTTSLEDARVAAEAGADMLGFILYDRSPRAVTPSKAAQSVQGLRDELGEAAPLMIGVFVDAPVREVRQRMEQVALDGVQLHGSEPPAGLRLLQLLAFKALRPQNRGDA